MLEPWTGEGNLSEKVPLQVELSGDANSPLRIEFSGDTLILSCFDSAGADSKVMREGSELG